VGAAACGYGERGLTLRRKWVEKKEKEGRRQNLRWDKIKVR